MDGNSSFRSTIKGFVMIEVFKTNVQHQVEATELRNLLQRYFPGSKIDFDLEDCDKVLRIEGSSFMPNKIMQLIHEHGYTCHVMD